MITQQRHYGLRVYHTEGGEYYAVGTERQVEAAAREYIRESLWVFRPEFLERFTPEAVDAEILRILIENKYEDATEIIARLVGDRLGDLIDEAIASDGRGHFLSPWDSEERDSDDIAGLPKGRLAYRIH